MRVIKLAKPSGSRKTNWFFMGFSKKEKNNSLRLGFIGIFQPWQRVQEVYCNRLLLFIKTDQG
jgi:hypothetical protein